jgi:hypothetical protein
MEQGNEPQSSDELQELLRADPAYELWLASIDKSAWRETDAYWTSFGKVLQSGRGTEDENPDL